MVSEQRYSMGEPSEILGSLIIEGGEIKEVKVGGIALRSGEIIIESQM